MADEPMFHTRDVVPKYQQSREIRADGGAPAEVRVGVVSLRATCLSCGEDWTARTTGRGRFMPALGGLVLKCPVCNAEATVTISSLE